LFLLTTQCILLSFVEQSAPPPQRGAYRSQGAGGPHSGPALRQEIDMANIREANAIAKRQLALRDQLWPSIAPYLWDRKAHKGFATIPKTMPLVLKLMDQLTKKEPISATYLSLWCSTWDNSFATLSKPRDLAHSSGFSGQRAEYTWSTRMKRLKGLGFIDIKPGKSGDMSYAIILNPHFAIRRLHEQGEIPSSIEATYTALLDLALEVGAKDMTNEIPLPPAHSVPKPKTIKIKIKAKPAQS
jgi:hypothetical protein